MGRRVEWDFRVVDLDLDGMMFASMVNEKRLVQEQVVVRHHKQFPRSTANINTNRKVSVNDFSINHPYVPLVPQIRDIAFSARGRHH